ncbi:UNVERIFIED_CONTAM: hypothetical protein HHA_282070 [Hammondia hammondi]|eukprot:XP_008887583.1 hypothetical protein HHA_282070 [Hammondia hammondi]
MCQAGAKDQGKQSSSSMEACWSGAAEAQFQLQRGEGLGYNSSGRVVAQMNGLAGSSAVSSGTSVSSQNADTKVPSWTNPSSMGPVFHSSPPTDMTGSAPSGTQNPVTPLFSVAQTQLGQPVQLNPGTRLISQDHTSVPFATTPTFPGNSRYASTVSDTFQAPSSFEGTRISSVSGHSISTSENHAAPQPQQLPVLRASGFPAAENSRKISNRSFTDRRSSVPGEYPSSDESASCTKTTGAAKRASVDCSLESNVNSQRTVISDVSSQPQRPEGSERRSRKPTCFDLLYNDALVRRARKQREEEALRSKPSNGQKQTPQQWEQRWSLMVKRHQEKLQTNENLRRKLDISKLEDERRECTFKPVTWSSRKPLAQQRSCLIKMKQLADKQKDLINAVCVLHQEERDIDDLIAKELQTDLACASESGNNEEVHKVLDFYRHLRAEETSRLRSLKLDLVSQVSRLEQQYKRTAAAVNLVESDIAATVGFDLKLAEQLNEEVRQDIDAANSLRLGARFRSILEAVTTGQPLFPPNERGVSLLYDGAAAAHSRRQSKGPDLASRSASRHRFSARGDSFSLGLGQRQRSPALSLRGASTRRVSRQTSQLRMHSSRSCSPGPSGPANRGVRRSTFGGDGAPPGFAKPLQQSMPLPQVSPRLPGVQGPASPALRAVSALYPSPELRSSSSNSGTNSSGPGNSGFGALTPSDPAGIHHPFASYPQNNQSPVKGFQMSGGFGTVIENDGIAFNTSGEGKPLEAASPAGASPRMLTSWQKEKAKNEMRQRLPSRHGSDGLWSVPLTSHRGSFNASGGFIDRDDGPSRVPSSRDATPRKAFQRPAAGLASTRNAFQSVSGYPLMHPPMVTQMPPNLGSASSPVANRQPGQAPGNVAASPRFVGRWNGQLSGQQVGAPGVMASNGGNPAAIDTLPNTQNDANLHSMHASGAGYMKAMEFMSNHPGNITNNAANVVASAGNVSHNAGGAVVVPRGPVQPIHQSCSVRPLGGAQLRPLMGNAFPCARAPNAMVETPGFPARTSVGFVQDKAAPMSAQPNYPMVAFQGAPVPVQGAWSFTPPSPRTLPCPVLAGTQAFLQKGVVQAESDKTGTSVSVQGNGSPAPFPTQTAVKQPLPGPQAPVWGAPTPNLHRLTGGAVLKLANNGHMAFVDFAATAKQLQRGGMASAR